MSTLSAVLWILGIAMGVVILCAIVIEEGKKREDKRYDERQQASRNAGYRVAFYVGLVYYIFISIGLSSAIDLNTLQTEPYLLVFFGILLQTLTLHVYALLTDSALPMGEKPMPAIVCYAGMGALRILTLLRQLEREPGMPLRGHGAGKWADLTFGIFFLLLALFHLISMLRRRKED